MTFIFKEKNMPKTAKYFKKFKYQKSNAECPEGAESFDK